MIIFAKLNMVGCTNALCLSSYFPLIRILKDVQKIQKCNEKKMFFVQKIVTNSIVFLFQGDIQLLYHKNLIHEMNLLLFLLLSTSIQNKTEIRKFSNKQQVRFCESHQ